jgi:urea transport system substrate-binding protein
MNKLYITVLAFLLIACGGNSSNEENTGIIKVGILHSLTGTMAISEKSVAEATLMAIEEINQNGGLLGRQIEPISVDGASDWDKFASEAENLISNQKVDVVFGCWTSASRKTVKPVFEKYNHLLFYPIQYEGLEQSKNIVYTGAAPNQQILPATKWAIDNLGKKIFIVGSDYVFPRTASAIMQDAIRDFGGEVVGDEYILLGSQKVNPIIEKIIAAKPDVIMNNINGDTNVEFFKQLVEAGITAEKIPVFSFSLAEDELRNLDKTNMAGHYTAWNYFQSIQSKKNNDFVEAYKAKYGSHRVTDDPIEAGYFGVYLWSEAVKKANSTDPEKVQKHLGGSSFEAPGGLVYIDKDTQHTWKQVHIGKFTTNGQVDIAWSSGKPIKPIPYPTTRSKSEWETFLLEMYGNWGGKWANPGNLVTVEK